MVIRISYRPHFFEHYIEILYFMNLDNEEGNQVSSEIDSVDQNPSPSPSANSPESSSPAIARDTGRFVS